jgi:hypothetical protein
MLGWKAVERRVEPGVAFELGQTILKAAGFKMHFNNPEYALFRRSGTQWAIKGERLPIEISLARTNAGLLLRARYDAFVFFDTGDLEKYTDELAAHLKPQNV